MKKNKTVRTFKLLVVFLETLDTPFSAPDDEPLVERYEVVERVKAATEHEARRTILQHHLSEGRQVLLISSNHT